MKEIRELYAKGWRPKIIAKHLGISEIYVRKFVAGLDKPAKQYNTDYVLTENLTERTFRLRSSLGYRLKQMLDAGMGAREVARITGVPQNKQREASERPFQYDWTLTQIERVMAHHNLKDIEC